MPYRFERDFETVQEGIRQIAAELLDDAISSAGRKGVLVHEKVHSARKACKKLRGLIRLVRPVFGDYRQENAAFRDTGRKLSVLRDCGVLIETYDALLQEYEDQVDRAKFASIRRRLTLWQQERIEKGDIPELFEDYCAALAKARKRAAHWQISAEGFDALEGGIKKAYKGARRAMSEVAKDSTAEGIHEWRKRVKDHWYHTRLLCPMWPKLLKAHSDVADQLGDMLGKHHDLEMFRQQLEKGNLGKAADTEVLVGLLQRRQKSLEQEALSVGVRLLAEAPANLVNRWRLYWNAWFEDNPRQAILAA